MLEIPTVKNAHTLGYEGDCITPVLGGSSRSRSTSTRRQPILQEALASYLVVLVLVLVLVLETPTVKNAHTPPDTRGLHYSSVGGSSTSRSTSTSTTAYFARGFAIYLVVHVLVLVLVLEIPTVKNAHTLGHQGTALLQCWGVEHEHDSLFCKRLWLAI